MKILLGILIGMFVLSRLNGGQSPFSAITSQFPGSTTGEVPYGGGAGAITAVPDPYFGTGGGGGSAPGSGGGGGSTSLRSGSSPGSYFNAFPGGAPVLTPLIRTRGFVRTV